MSINPYRLKAVTVFAEKVEGDMNQVLDIAERWNASVTYYPDRGATVTLMSGLVPGATRTAKVGDWLVDKPGEGKAVVSDDDFTASFEAAG